MTTNTQRKQIFDKFEEHVFENYVKYCTQHQLPCSLNGLIAYLIDFEIIPQKAIQRYTILNEFEVLYPKEQFQKTKTVVSLADRFNISERSVWSILKRFNVASKKLVRTPPV